MKIFTRLHGAGLAILLIVVMGACGSFKELNDPDNQDTPATFVAATPASPTMQASPESPPADPDSTFALAPDSNLVIYGVEESKKVTRVSSYDILHTELDLRFDFEKHRVFGVATHRIRLSDSSPSSILFDGRDMDIDGVQIDSGSGAGKARFKYSDGDIVVAIPRDIETSEFELSISYTAHPMRNGQKKGLYFVDGSMTDPSRPTQIWTLGQPEDNQYWYPTWDYPSDRMSFDIRLTVPEAMQSFANGTLVSQQPQSEGLRTDHWQMNDAHLGYLAAFAVGNFSSESVEFVRGDGSVVPLMYYVEPAYRHQIDLIYGETPDMLEFLESNLNVSYPWQNYKQIAVHDFAAGGMENTTATILSDRVQHDDRAALDYSPRDLLMHELAHQWFGNYVSAADWGHLALNEGLASYMEEAYLLARFGEEAKQIHAHEERLEYFEESKIFQRPIVWYGYDDPYEVYDDHTYEKASQALGQLRYEIGDDAFFRGLNQFLREYGGMSATIGNLERSFTSATGRELAGFFSQWFYTAGHPVLDVSAGYRSDIGIYQFSVSQRQTDWGVPVFSFPVDVEVVFENRPAYRERVYISSRDTTIAIGVAGRVLYGSFNRYGNLFAEILETKPTRESISQAANDDDMLGRFKALEALEEATPTDAIRDVAIDRVLNDGHYFVRARAAELLGTYARDRKAMNALIRAASLDKSSKVRRQSIISLYNSDNPSVEGIFVDALADSSYRVVGASAIGLSTRFPQRATTHLQQIASVQSWGNIVELAVIEASQILATADAINLLTGYLDVAMPERVRSAAVRAMGAIAESNPELNGTIKKVLKNLRQDVHVSVRVAANEALDRI
ncbi:MAG: M1 family metallopeptidase [Rhodothermales bacterium]|nr:M1 family metallopeptidase [Rhodothermales bacterium]